MTLLEYLAWLFTMSPFIVALLLPGCTCCSCTIVTDDFSTNTIANYSQRAGTWSVSFNRLQTSSASALIVSSTALPSSATGFRFVSTSGQGATTDKPRFVFAYSSDSSYWYVELQPGATDGTVKLFDSGGSQRGSTQTLPGYDSGKSPAVQICYDGSVLTVTAATTSTGFGGANSIRFSLTASITVASTKVGFGTGSGSSLCIFDNFTLSKSTFDQADCPTCYSARCCFINPDPNGLGGQPTRYQLVVAPGTFSNGGICTDCDALNATYLIPFSDIDAFGTLDYTTSFSATCTVTTISVQLCYNGASGITFSMGGGPAFGCSFVASAGVVCRNGSTSMSGLSCSPRIGGGSPGAQCLFPADGSGFTLTALSS